MRFGLKRDSLVDVFYDLLVDRLSSPYIYYLKRSIFLWPLIMVALFFAHIQTLALINWSLLSGGAALCIWHWGKRTIDEAWDRGDHLLLKQGALEERIPLTAIEDVRFIRGRNMNLIELNLKIDSEFGNKIRFLPYAIWEPAVGCLQVDGLKARLR